MQALLQDFQDFQHLAGLENPSIKTALPSQTPAGTRDHRDSHEKESLLTKKGTLWTKLFQVAKISHRIHLSRHCFEQNRTGKAGVCIHSGEMQGGVKLLCHGTIKQGNVLILSQYAKVSRISGLLSISVSVITTIIWSLCTDWLSSGLRLHCNGYCADTAF